MKVEFKLTTKRAQYDDWARILSEHFPVRDAKTAEREWNALKDRTRVGDRVSGTVVAKADFGAWIDLGVGFPALLEIILIEGMTPERYKSGDGCPVGTEVTAFVGVFNDVKHQIALQQFTSPWM